jgi:hemerythrin
LNTFVTWTDALSVGIDAIDAQHRVLVDLVNEMHDAMVRNYGNQVVDDILTRLAEYARIHFALEEGLMRMQGYPRLEEHKQEHLDLISRLNDLRARFDSGNTKLSMELMDLLKFWLTTHIMESDQHYARFFVESGALSSQAQRSWIFRIWDHLND